jgi:hypothetical protein
MRLSLRKNRVETILMAARRRLVSANVTDAQSAHSYLLGSAHVVLHKA